MNQTLYKFIILILAGALLAGPAQAKRSYLNSVNSTCGTNDGCDLCHVDPKGGGQLNPDGEAFLASGYDPTIFCPGTGCTDGDGDGFSLEGPASGCGTVDCDDNNAAINPGAAEICDDGTDNDCDNSTDCDDNECTNFPACQTGGGPEVCDDGLDNDNDGKTDCADKKDCKNDSACTGGGPGGDAEICNDGIDNDGDNKIDCADRKDCRTDPFCQ